MFTLQQSPLAITEVRDIRGRRRSSSTMPGFRKGISPKTKGKKFPPDPIAVEDIFKLIKACEPPNYPKPRLDQQLGALRLQALIALLWRSGLRISEALALEERDLNRHDFSITVRHGKGDKRRVSAMDEWGWQALEQWRIARKELPYGALFCVLTGSTAGRSVHASDIRRQLRRAAKRAGLRRRANPHCFRHEHAVELWREGIDVYRIQQQLGHARLDVTALYLRSVSPIELLEPIGKRTRPMMPVPHTKYLPTR